MPSKYQTVEFEFDVDDLDEDELVDACRELGYSVLKTGETVDPDDLTTEMNNLAELYRNDDPRLMEELRTFLQTYTGRILP